MTAAEALAEVPRRDGMTAYGFLRWTADCGYTCETQVAADLCVAIPTVNRLRTGTLGVQPEIERLCGIIRLLHSVAGIDAGKVADPRDRDAILRARGLLAPRDRPAPVPEIGTQRAGRVMRLDRLCQLAAMVFRLSRGSDDPALRPACRRAAAMVREWEAGGRRG